MKKTLVGVVCVLTLCFTACGRGEPSEVAENQSHEVIEQASPEQLPEQIQVPEQEPYDNDDATDEVEINTDIEHHFNREHMIQSLLAARACYETIAANIADLSKSPRVRATEDEARTIAFIVETLESYGYSPTVQSFDWYRTTRDGRHAGGITNMNPLNEAYPMGTSYNVILDIISPYANDEVFLFVAHHDTVPNCIGAIDNATGAAALLELARLINGISFPFDIRFIFFGAEKYQIMGQDIMWQTFRPMNGNV